MTKTIRKWFATALDRPDPVRRLTRADLEARADRIAHEWVHVGTREEAFQKLDRGELEGTLAEPELIAIRDMLASAA